MFNIIPGAALPKLKWRYLPVLFIFIFLNGCGSLGFAGFFGKNRSSDQAGSGEPQASQPLWVTEPYSVYDRASFLAAVGHGSSRDAAGRNALTALTAFFGQSIQSDLRTLSAYTEAVTDGTIRVSSETNEITEALRISVDMDTLIGAEIRDFWYDTKNVYYAAAVMEKAGAAKLYTDLIVSNTRIINELTNLSDGEKYSLDGVVNYHRAASVADTSAVFIKVLSAIGSAEDFDAVKKGEEYRIQAAEIIKRIPIRVRVSNDRADRIKGAFAEVLTRMGFRTGGNDSRYVLDVKTILSEVVLDGPYKWYRYEINAELIDTRNRAVLVPYSITDRKGHAQLEEAENRAVAHAEEIILGSFGDVLGAYLTRLSEKKKT
ncbi:MAG: LPP20 family lipoprotein [Treponema sp.]|jgi:hypothetical protein|nr:LPP20 family lipoprotein [Treponema sp.]